MPATSPSYRHSKALKALALAAQALEGVEQRQYQKEALPSQAGSVWSKAEDKRLCEAFEANIPIKWLAQSHHRTTGSTYRVAGGTILAAQFWFHYQ